MILLKKVMKLLEKQKKLIMHFAGAVRGFEMSFFMLVFAAAAHSLWGRCVIVLLQIGRWFSLMPFMTSSVIKNFHKNVWRNYFPANFTAVVFLQVFIALFTLKCRQFNCEM